MLRGAFLILVGLLVLYLVQRDALNCALAFAQCVRRKL